ncbi:hypothetical protein L2E82_03124 [Cichorium intybus]|uniref:Uncharacterized protein n=1 Tax=Cichorium intybus TaxID=13427 RepID=A0ACB9H4H6_CICIN|nr:hypothetical protein L2E82_03124 [Cichorium intybus]
MQSQNKKETKEKSQSRAEHGSTVLREEQIKAMVYGRNNMAMLQKAEKLKSEANERNEGDQEFSCNPSNPLTRKGTQRSNQSPRVLLGSGSFIARNLTLPSTTGNGSTPPLLSPLQAAHRQIWSSAYPNRELPGLKSEVWKEMGW